MGDIDFVIRFNNSNGKAEAMSSEKEDIDAAYEPSGNPLRRFADAVREEFGVLGEFDAEGEGDTARMSSGRVPAGEHLSYLEVIEQTRVPLLKFTVMPYNIDVDVCFDQPHGPES